MRFGNFELDVESGELYQDGRKIQIQEQSLRVLKLLLEKPGELVSREEIRSRLWPNGTVVEFVNAVNATVKKLRAILGDSADEPLYIETLKGHGYRLIMPVQISVIGGSESGMAAVVNKPHVDSHPVTPGRHFAGQRISHYRILEQIGAGGMGVVYRAEDTRLGREVALKFISEELSSHPANWERLRLEARSASAMNHPNICTIYDIGEEAGLPFIAMELLEGSTLRDKILSCSPLPFKEVLDYAVQISEGLHAAHGTGIVHRDIKPANIFITRRGQAKILDFGLANPGNAAEAGRQSVEGGMSQITRPGSRAGTIAYMSPEQVMGKPLDPRSDLFSFGVVLYETATGSKPFRAVKDGEIPDAILDDDPPALVRPNPHIPPQLDLIIRRCLQKDREQRYQNASELRLELQHLQQDLPRPNWMNFVLLAVAAVLVVTVAAYLNFKRSRPSNLTGADSIVLADFVNKTGESVFDGTLRKALSVELEQSPLLSIISEHCVQKALRLMARPADSRITPDLALEICERTGAAAVLEGSIASLGTRYLLTLRARNCRTGNIQHAEQLQAARKEDVLNTLTQIARGFRTRLGESLGRLSEHDVPLAEATTASLDAWKAYATGWKIHTSKGSTAALPFFRRATEIDPEFAMAHASLGRMYADIDEPGLSAQSLRRAWVLRDRTSDPEKFFIAANYELLVTGNLERARQTAEQWAETYPRDVRPHAMLSGMVNKARGQFERAAAEGRKAIELDPDYGIAYYNLAVNYANLNRLQQAKDTIRRAIERGLEIDELLMLQYDLAFVKDDVPGMERIGSQARARPGGESLVTSKEASALAYTGQLKQAARLSRLAVAEAQSASQRERAGAFEALAAVREAFFGNVSEARKTARSALELSRDRDVEYGAAFALALSGDFKAAEALAEDLEKRFPEDTSVQFSYLPVLRAHVALNRGNISGALESLQFAVPHEMGMTWTWFGALYPIYMRGEIYLVSHQGAKAAAEFQKILDHRAIVMADPVGALARLQLGRALAMTGDKSKAIVAYQDFLRLWKDADPDIPILKQAKAEYTRLQ